MAATLRSTASGSADSTTSLTTTLGTHAIDDILVVVVFSITAVQNALTFSGWTREVHASTTTQTDRDVQVFTKKATSASETAPNWTGLTSSNFVYFSQAWDGCDLSTWIDATPTTGTFQNDATPAPASITTVTDNAAVIVAGADEKGTAYAPSSGYTENTEDTSGAANGMIQSLADAGASGVKTPGDYTITHGGGGPDSIVVTIALRPEVTGLSVSGTGRRD
jgi:hypothetical protein